MRKRPAASVSHPSGWGALAPAVLFLLSVPALIVGALWGVAAWQNDRAAAGALSCRMSPSLIVGEGAAEASFAFSAATGGEQAPEVDMVVLVDVSGSMRSVLPHIGAAVRDLAGRLMDGSGRIRLSVVRFDDPAVIDVPWTSSVEAIHRGTASLETMAGNNDTREAFQRLRELLDGGRPGSRKIAVFFTDGALDVESGVMTWGEMENEAAQLREGRHQVRFYAIGLPGYLDSSMSRITGSDAKLLNISGIGGFSSQLQQVVNREFSVFAEGARLDVPVYGAAFSPQPGHTPWVTGDGEALTFGGWTLLAGANVVRMPLKAASHGLWSLGAGAPVLTWRRPDGAEGSAACNAAPMVLVVPWWLLLLGTLPALAYLVWGAERLLRKTLVAPPLALPPLPQPPPLEIIPLPATGPEGREIRPQPTLVIGLGGEGGRAARIMAADIEHRLGRRILDRMSFLHMDLEAGGESSGSVATINPQREVLDLSAVIAKPPSIVEGWFDSGRYRHAARADFDMSQGAKGDRMLGRLAWFKWLESEALLRRLGEELDRVAKASDGVPPQILFLCSTGGGFGGGAVIDAARLLRRLDRRRSRVAGQPAAEIVLLMAAATGDNQQALVEELAMAQLSGRRPHPTVYGQGDLLDAVDDEAPFNWMLAATGEACGGDLLETCACLGDADLREALVRSLPATMTSPVEVSAKSLVVLPEQVRDIVADQLTLRVAAQLLPDLAPDPSGGYRLQPPSPERAGNCLELWAESDATGGAWKSLLNAALQEEFDEFHQEHEQHGAPADDWYLRALAASVGNMLGAPDKNWDAVGGAAALGLFAERLRAEGHPLLARIAQGADDLADRLLAWVAELPGHCENLARRIEMLGRLEQTCASPGRRTFISPVVDGAGLDRLCEDVFEGLRGSMPLVRYLHFSVLSEGTHPRIFLSSGLGRARRFHSAGEAVMELRACFRDVAGQIRAASVDGALRELDPARARECLDGIAASSASEAAMISVPPPGWIADMVPVPAGLRRWRIIAGSDPSSVRMVEWGPFRTVRPRARDRFVQASAVAAETMRSALESDLDLMIPALPSELAIALSRPDSFHRFARAYDCGLVRRMPSSDGHAHWRFMPSGSALTHERDETLAAAAAFFGHLDEGRGVDGETGHGDFSALDQWMRGNDAGAEMADILTLAAIRKVLR